MTNQQDFKAAEALIGGRPRVSFNIPSRAIRVCYGGHHGRQKYFSVAKYGSWAAAAVEAVLFERGLSDFDRAGSRLPRLKPTARSESGIVGVNPYYDYRRSFEILGWQAQWVEPREGKRGRNRSKLFLLSTWGPDAKVYAIEHREEMMRKLHPYIYEA